MLTDSQKTVLIRKEIAQSYKDFKTKYPIFKHQNAIGFTIFLVSIFCIFLSSYFYLKNQLSLIPMILINAFFMGILHELEHDLIHWMYFRKNKFMQDAMLFVIWLLRPLTINPWLRRELHFHHHKYSGSLHDVEERGVTNGEKWSLKRLIGTPDLILGSIFRAKKLIKDIKNEVRIGNLSKEQALRFKEINKISMLPFGLLSYLIWYIFISYWLVFFITNLLNYQFQMPPFIEHQMQWINPFVAIIIAPNIIRQFCLHFITSNMHYFGDVESGNVMQQTQFLTVWWTFPLQIFCFFFGWTHAIHHFVVNETFYVRHLTRKKAQKIMIEQGVRINDLGTFKRANRYKVGINSINN